MTLDQNLEALAHGLDLPVDVLRGYYGPPWHSDLNRSKVWLWSYDVTPTDVATGILDGLQQKGDLVEVWVWSDVGAYCRIEGVRGAAMPLFVHQYEGSTHIYQRCLGPA